MRLVNAVAFALHLRQTAEFSEAMGDAAISNADPDNPPPPRDRTHDVSRSSIQRATTKMDIMGVNLQRRCCCFRELRSQGMP